MRTYTFWDEPAHGYLEVTEDELIELGLGKENFPHSPTEYRQGQCFVYLEEDDDAPRFCQAYQQAYGRQPEINTITASARINNIGR